MTEVSNFVEERDLKGLRHWLSKHAVLDIAEALSRLEPEERAIAFRLLPKDRALDVFEMLDPVVQQEILSFLREPNVREILEKMEPDDRARLLDEMPPELAKQLLEGLSYKERKLTSILLGYPDDSVGRIMSPEFVELFSTMSAGEAMARVRQSGRGVESIYFLPVADKSGNFTGSLDLGDLVLADPSTEIGNLTSRDNYSVRADENQEAASRLLLEAGLFALPVVDKGNRLVGVLTFDDAMEVLKESDTEDIQRSGGSEPLGAPYFAVSIFHLTKIRAIWLFVLAFAATLTVNVLKVFQSTLESVISLSLFIPLLIGIGGNIGSQSATIIVRAMAIGEVRFGDFFGVLFREMRVGLLLGLTLGTAGFALVSLLFSVEIALILSSSLLSISILAALIGSALPMAARKIGMDPAVVSAPIISTLLDASGLIIYFLIARLILHL